ncbi:MAG: ribbon-helix-helix protein, CopG family [Acidimicrobiales bacterium]|nr:ribbon-helix-helix protein, CopG family [Acidimicrobiales bacterium]
MRTTIDLEPDTAKAVEHLRKEQGLGLSEAVNQLIRRGLVATPAPSPFRPIHRDLGLMIDVSNVAEALELLDGPETR